MLSTVEKDRQLSLILSEYLRQSLADLPTEDELAATMTLSPEFEARMLPLLAKARKMEDRMKKAELTSITFSTSKKIPVRRTKFTNRKRLIAVMLVLAVLASTLSISAARERLFDFFIQIYERYSELSFIKPNQTTETTPVTDPASKNSEGLLPDRIPTGYVETDRLELVGLVQIVYADKAGSEVMFSRHLADGLKIGINTEGIQTENVTIHGTNGLYYSNKGIQNVIWKEGPFVYTLSGQIEKEVLISMAEGTK